MKVLETYFDKAFLLETPLFESCRGTMQNVFSEEAFREAGIDLTIRDLRTYVMPKTGTFFGIHYYDEKTPVNRILTLSAGRGMDYLIDLRPDSPTYLQWVSYELSAENHRVVYIPYGIGHAFISLAENTIQVYATDAVGGMGITRQLNYQEKKIGLALPVPITAIVEYDVNAPFLPDA
ncbi:MAG: dTDP-4-dehydrorhamnose 3,5-epimerase family protein [Clostridiales bacterium]|nr:dTDP-4-dehydrorhamnose 3,5-epimerase family protein [Clostridiales bacterium]